MKRKSLISALTLIASLSGYFYAKHTEKDPVPIVMVTGFFGAMIVEALVKWMDEEDNNDKTPPTSYI